MNDIQCLKSNYLTLETTVIKVSVIHAVRRVLTAVRDTCEKHRCKKRSI